MEENQAVFIVHHQSSGPGCPWPIHCELCNICYWTSRENEEAALAAGMKALCIYCVMLFAVMGEPVVYAGGIKNGKVVERKPNA